MKLRVSFLILICMVSFIGVPKKSYAIQTEICDVVDDILSVLPGSVGFIDGWRIRCSFRGCRTYWRCHSMNIGEQIEFSLTLVCNAMTMYGPDFFPNSTLLDINGELLNIQNVLGNLASIANPSMDNSIDSSLLGNAFGDIEGSLGNIESLLPPAPSTDRRWVRRKRHCAVETDNTEEAANQEAQEESAPEEEEDPACSLGLIDLETEELPPECLGDETFEGLEEGNTEDYNNQLQEEIDATCGGMTGADYDSCVTDVTDTFEYVPSGDVLDQIDQAAQDEIDSANEDIGNAGDSGDVSTDADGDLCLTPEQVAQLPDYVPVDPDMVCP